MRFKRALHVRAQFDQRAYKRKPAEKSAGFFVSQLTCSPKSAQS
jgi:hypothetical protein